MHHFAVPLENYAASNTETAIRIRQSGKNEYALGALTEGPHSSQARYQPMIHGYNSYNPYNPSVLPSSDVNILEHNTSPSAIDNFSHLDYTYNRTWSHMPMGQVDSLGGFVTTANGNILGDLAEERQELQPNSILPQGITGHSRVMLDHQWLGNENYDSGPIKQNARVDNQRIYYKEEVKARKGAGPRINPKDETSAERRRTQLRLAQRAYRQRQESTISSLEKKAEGLLGVKEEMGNIMVELYSNAVCIGLLQREPEFSQLLQSTAAKFWTLAKCPVDGSHEDGCEVNHAQGRERES